MNKESVLQLGIILLGLIGGVSFSKRAGMLHQQMEQEHIRTSTIMNHGILDVSQDSIIPEIKNLRVTEDKMNGWNILIDTKEFKFTPENVNQKHVPGEGHAHLYINGKKFARLYSPAFHIPNITEGIQEIKVTLNANGHETLAIDDEPIQKIRVMD